MIPPRHDPCATCGACCTSYIVTVSGYDVWRLCTRQHLRPEQFLVAVPQEQTGRDGFVLDAAGPPYCLMLDKQGPLRATQPCVFLLRLGGGHLRCGVYAERPVVCQTYPMTLREDEVLVRPKALCPPDSWPAEDVRRPRWRDAIQRQRMDFDVYYQVVARWNGRFSAGDSANAGARTGLPAIVAGNARGTWRATASPGRRFALSDYFDYLLNVYDRIAALDAQVGEHELARVRDEWGAVPAATGASREGQPVELHVRPGEHAWLDYLLQARRVIDGFYPEVPPQPLSLQRLVARPQPTAAPADAPQPGARLGPEDGAIEQAMQPAKQPAKPEPTRRR